jgi:hypothetical protein
MGDFFQDKAYVSTSTLFDPESVGKAYGIDDNFHFMDINEEYINKHGKYVKKISHRDVTIPSIGKRTIIDIDLEIKCCYMKIKIPKGANVLALYLLTSNNNIHENEILLPRNAKFIFKGDSIEENTGILNFDALVSDETAPLGHPSGMCARRARVEWECYRDDILLDIARHKCNKFNDNLLLIEKSVNKRLSINKRKKIIIKILSLILTDNLFIDKPNREDIEYFIYDNYKRQIKIYL